MNYNNSYLLPTTYKRIYDIDFIIKSSENIIYYLYHLINTLQLYYIKKLMIKLLILNYLIQEKK